MKRTCFWVAQDYSVFTSSAQPDRMLSSIIAESLHLAHLLQGTVPPIKPVPCMAPFPHRPLVARAIHHTSLTCKEIICKSITIDLARQAISTPYARRYWHLLAASQASCTQHGLQTSTGSSSIKIGPPPCSRRHLTLVR
jgi:hypothetical protein